MTGPVRPVIVRRPPPDDPNGRGEYVGPSPFSTGDTLYLNTGGQPSNAPDAFVFAHEMGHRMYSQVDPDLPDRFRAPGAAQPDSALSETARAIVSRHGSTAPTEEFARAVAEAAGQRMGMSYTNPQGRANPQDVQALARWFDSHPDAVPTMPQDNQQADMVSGDPILDNAKKLRASGATIEEVRGYLHSKGYDTGDAPSAVAAAKPQAQPVPFSRAHPTIYNTIQTANNALTFGLGPKIDALLSASGDALTGKDSFNHSLTSHLDSDRAGMQQLAREHPVLSGAANVAGNVGMTLASGPLGIVDAMLPEGASAARPVVRAGRAIAAGAKAGAPIGAISALGNAPAQGGLGDQAWTAAKGATVGGLIGGGVAASPFVVRGGSTVKNVAGAANPAERIIQREESRKTASAVNFDNALAQGYGKVTPPDVEKFLAEPDVAPIVDALKGTRLFGAMEPTNPKFLDEIYKTMSDKSGMLSKRLGLAESGTGTALNVPRVQQGEIRSAKDQLLAGMDAETPLDKPAVTTAQSPAPTLREGLQNFRDRQTAAAKRNPGNETVAQQQARTALERHGAENVVSPPLTGQPEVETAPFMPGYRTAVMEEAKRRAEEGAFDRGTLAGKMSLRKQTPSPKQQRTISPPAMGRWAQAGQRSEAERQAALEAIYGNANDAIHRSPFTNGRRALTGAMSLRNAIEPMNDPMDSDAMLRTLGLTNLSFSTP